MHKRRPHGKGEGVKQKRTNAEQGGGGLSESGRPQLGAKNSSC